MATAPFISKQLHLWCLVGGQALTFRFRGGNVACYVKQTRTETFCLLFSVSTLWEIAGWFGRQPSTCKACKLELSLWSFFTRSNFADDVSISQTIGTQSVGTINLPLLYEWKWQKVDSLCLMYRGPNRTLFFCIETVAMPTTISYVQYILKAEKTPPRTFKVEESLFRMTFNFIFISLEFRPNLELSGF